MNLSKNVRNSMIACLLDVRMCGCVRFPRRVRDPGGVGSPGLLRRRPRRGPTREVPIAAALSEEVERYFAHLGRWLHSQQVGPPPREEPLRGPASPRDSFFSSVGLGSGCRSPPCVGVCQHLVPLSRRRPENFVDLRVPISLISVGGMVG